MWRLPISVWSSVERRCCWLRCQTRFDHRSGTGRVGSADPLQTYQTSHDLSTRLGRRTRIIAQELDGGEAWHNGGGHPGINPFAATMDDESPGVGCVNSGLVDSGAGADQVLQKLLRRWVGVKLPTGLHRRAKNCT